MTDLCPFILQRVNEVAHILLSLLRYDGLQTLDDAAFLLQVGLHLVDLAGVGGFACIEESVACGVEAFPDGIAVFLWHGADFSPLLLQFLDGLGGSFPIGAVLQSLSLLAECLLEIEVGAERFLHLLEVLGLEGEELVASSAVALVNLLVHLLRCETDGLPLGLKGCDGVGHGIPLGEGLQVVGVDLLQFLADGSLLGQVLLFLFLALVEILLMAAIDNGGCSLEAVPHLFALVLVNRAYLTELLVQVLQCAGGSNHISHLCQFLRSLAECGLQLQVLLEVVCAELIVEFQCVIERLHAQLIRFPEVSGLVLRHSLDLLPLLLQLLEIII